MIKKLIKKIRKYTSLRMRAQHEILECLVTMCLITAHTQRYSPRKTPFDEYLTSHAKTLKSLSEETREFVRDEGLIKETEYETRSL